MFAKLNGRAGHYLMLLAAGLILFMNNLGGPSLWDLDEGRNATAALEMLESGNFIVPTFNAQLRADKPALLYWLQIGSIQIFGINEVAVRFPSALAALATLLCCYELGRALFGPFTGLLGGLILSSTAMMIGAGRFANPDALLNFFIVATLTVFWRGHNRARGRWFAGMGMLLGLAVLAKGPVGVVLPLLVMTAFLAWEKRLAVLWDRKILIGAAALALVAMPWYIWVTVATRGSFLRAFLWNHNLGRFFAPMDAHAGSPLYYVLVLLVGLAPWSIAIFFACWYGGWSMVRVPHPMHAARWQTAGDFAGGGTESSIKAYRFLGAWLGCYLIFFSMAATKLPNYLLPVAMPLALLTARFFERWRLGDINPPRWVVLSCLGSMAGFGILAGLAMAALSGKFFSRPLAGVDIEGLEYMALFGLAPALAALLARSYWRKRDLQAVIGTLVLGNIVFLAPLIAWAVPAWDRIKAPKSLVEQLGADLPARDIRLGGFHLDHLPSINFYAQREIIHHETEDETLAFLNYQVPVYLFVQAGHWDNLKKKAPAHCRLVAHHADLYHFNDIVVVTNCPP